MDWIPGKTLSRGQEGKKELTGKFKENQSWTLVKAFKNRFIQDYCNRKKETSAYNWVQFQIHHGQVGIYGQGAGCGSVGKIWNIKSMKGFCLNKPNKILAESKSGWSDTKEWKMKDLIRYQEWSVMEGGRFSLKWLSKILVTTGWCKLDKDRHWLYREH